MRLLAYLLSIALAVEPVALKIGDTVELTNFLNARSKATTFYGRRNVVKTLPAGTKGKIAELNQLRSGSYALNLEITDGPDKGKKYWVYYHKDESKRRVRLMDASGTTTTDTAAATDAQTTKDTPAVVDNTQTTPDPGVAPQDRVAAPTPTPTPPQPAAAAAPQPAADGACPVNPNAADVIYIGDSHSTDCFGAALEDSMQKLMVPGRTDPVRVRFAATCGTGAGAWLSTGHNGSMCGTRFRKPGDAQATTTGATTKAVAGPSLKTLTCEERSTKPGSIVIELGTNMVKAPIATAMAQVEALIKEARASGRSCVWIGPPQATPTFAPIATYTTFVKALKAKVESGGCTFIDSEPLTDRGNVSDPLGYHYNCPGSADTWAKRVKIPLTQALTRQLGAAAPAASSTTTPGARSQ